MTYAPDDLSIADCSVFFKKNFRYFERHFYVFCHYFGLVLIQKFKTVIPFLGPRADRT